MRSVYYNLELYISKNNNNLLIIWCYIYINKSKRVYNIKRTKIEDKARYININWKNHLKDNFFMHT